MKQPDMRFVRVKSPEQQASRSLERSRDLLVRQHTQLCNSLRAQMAEQGIIAAQGRKGFTTLIEDLDSGDARLPEALVPVLQVLRAQLEQLAEAIAELEARIVKAARTDPDMRRLATIPGVGPILAHAIVSAIGDGQQ